MMDQSRGLTPLLQEAADEPPVWPEEERLSGFRGNPAASSGLLTEPAALQQKSDADLVDYWFDLYTFLFL